MTAQGFQSGFSDPNATLLHHRGGLPRRLGHSSPSRAKVYPLRLACTPFALVGEGERNSVRRAPSEI